MPSVSFSVTYCEKQSKAAATIFEGLQVFVFDADSQHAPEPPMILQPCRLLQSMEDIVQQRGDTVVFVLSGQVHVYRGANYLLPTLMRIAIDRGNLE